LECPYEPAQKKNNIYLRDGRKHWRKLDHFTPEEAKAKMDEDIPKGMANMAKLAGDVAKWKAKAAEAPKLLTEVERVEDKLHKRTHDLALLAAQFYACDDRLTVDQAAELAVKQMAAVRKILSPQAIAATQEKATTCHHRQMHFAPDFSATAKWGTY
jgi:dsDNA-specific endonuclease/ATPase MutS2